MTSDDASPPGAAEPSRLRPYLSTDAPQDWDPAADSQARHAAATDHPARLPPYLLTGGRARPIDEGLEIEAQVVATAAGRGDLAQLSFESGDIVAECDEPLALAEVAARLGLHLGVTRVLVSDLITTGHLAVRRPEVDRRRRAQIIERVIRGLQEIP